MASYAQLFELRGDSALRNKIAIACIVAAETIRSEPVNTANHANRVLWAKAVFENPEQKAVQMFWAALAANNTLTTAQIQAANDAALQTAVNNAVDLVA